MTVFFFLCTTLIGASFSEASLTVEDVILKHRDNLKLFLDWSHRFLEAYEQQKLTHIETINARNDPFIAKGTDGLPIPLASFLYAATHIRKVLVKGNNYCMISDQLVDNARICTIFMSNMPYVLDDLQKSIKEWVNDEHMLRTSLRVLDEKPLKWFKDHGFDESSLNDLTIPEVEVVMHKLYFNEKPFDFLLTFFGMPHTNVCSSDLGSRLAWLYTVGSNPKPLYSLENYLRREGSTVQPKIITGILEYLRKLGDKEGSLSRLFGSSRDGGLYPFIMPMLGKASFFDGHCEQYMNILIDICSNMVGDLLVLIDALEAIPRDSTFRFYRDLGFLYNTDKSDVQKSISHIESLIGNEGPITRLAQYVWQSQQNGELRNITTSRKWSCHDILYITGLASMGVHLTSKSDVMPC